MGSANTNQRKYKGSVYMGSQRLNSSQSEVIIQRPPQFQFPRQQMVAPPPPPMQINRNRNPPPPPSQPTVINCELSIREVAIKNNILEFIADANTAGVANFYVHCQENYNTINQFSNGIQSYKQNESTQIQQPQKNLKIKSKQNIDQLFYLEHHQNDKIWPLIITIENRSMLMLYYYQSEDGQPKLKKQKYQSPLGAFEIQEIYGIQNSGLMDKQNVAMREDMKEQCIICVDEPVDSIIMPCRHMCLCTQCAALIKQKKDEYDQSRAQRQQQSNRNLPNPNQCPVCRKEIESFIRLKKVGQ